MADSMLTKRALASALKELMQEYPFEKINVGQICEKCDMNRKSFYYHFKDKYDLVNWIFDMEFISILQEEALATPSWDLEKRWKNFDVLCEMFYTDRDFYRKALKIKGQNSFSDHFRECIRPILKIRIETHYDDITPNPFIIDFLSDACLSALERWLSDKNCMQPDEFSSLLKSIVQSLAVSIATEINTSI